MAVLRRAVELEINFIDTAKLIAEAARSVSEGTGDRHEGWFDRSGPNQWEENGRPERLREELEGSLKRLRVDQIDLYQLHRIDSKFPKRSKFEAFRAFQREGKIRHIGLSEVTVTTVQNRYNLEDRAWEKVVDYCEKENIGFIPWFPLAAGKLATKKGPLTDIAKKHDATPAQVALAWLLKRSPVMLPIPGTSKVKHLEENVAAVGIELTDEEFERIAEG